MEKSYKFEEKKTKNDEKNRKNKVKAVIGGCFCGLINGLFGGGGGMIVVPILTMALGLAVKKAHATAILIILPLSIISTFFYLFFGSSNFEIIFPVGIGVILGGVLGAFLLKKLSSKWVVIIFSVLMASAGVKMLVF